MSNFLYVDNSNVWIEGMRVSAVRKGKARNIKAAHDEEILDDTWSYDFGKLMEFVGGQKEEIGRAVLYGSRPPPNDSLWDLAKRRGFEAKVFDRNLQNREKKIDTQITLDIANDTHERLKKGDEVTLVAGDKDFVPVAESVKQRGIPFHVVFWSHASRELKEIASTFTDLETQFEFISKK